MASQPFTLAGAQAAATVACSAATGTGTVGFNFSGTFVGTLTFEATYGTTWFAVNASPILSGTPGAPVATATAIGQFIVPIYGYTSVRARMSSYTSGTVNVEADLQTSNEVGPQLVSTEGFKSTYFWAKNAHAPQATPNNIVTLKGSATKTIRITRVRLQARATAGTQWRMSQVVYRTAYLTGGTGDTIITPVLADGNDGAATAIVTTWAAGNPTSGTTAAIIYDESLPVAVLGTPAAGLFPAVYDYGTRNGRAIVLRGTTQYFAIDGAGAAVPGGGVLDVHLEWTEE